MSHIKVEVKKELTENVFLNPPMFWKSPATSYHEYVGLLDEITVVKVLFLSDYTVIKNGTPESMNAELTEAHKNFYLSSESVFFAAFDEAYESMRLSPEIRQGAGEYHEPEEKEELIPVENKEY